MSASTIPGLITAIPISGRATTHPATSSSTDGPTSPIPTTGRQRCLRHRQCRRPGGGDGRNRGRDRHRAGVHPSHAGGQPREPDADGERGPQRHRQCAGQHADRQRRRQRAERPRRRRHDDRRSEQRHLLRRRLRRPGLRSGGWRHRHCADLGQLRADRRSGDRDPADEQRRGHHGGQPVRKRVRQQHLRQCRRQHPAWRPRAGRPRRQERVRHGRLPRQDRLRQRHPQRGDRSLRERGGARSRTPSSTSRA